MTLRQMHQAAVPTPPGSPETHKAELAAAMRAEVSANYRLDSAPTPPGEEDEHDSNGSSEASERWADAREPEPEPEPGTVPGPERGSEPELGKVKLGETNDDDDDIDDMDMDEPTVSPEFPFLRAVHAFDAKTLAGAGTDGKSGGGADPTSVCLSFEENDMVLVHSVHESGWGDATLMSTGERGWIPTNYFVAYTEAKAIPLLSAILTFVMNPKSYPIRQRSRDGSSGSSAASETQYSFSQASVTNIVAGVRSLLDACGALTRDTPVVTRSQSVRRFRKSLLTELAFLVSVAKQHRNSTADDVIERLVRGCYKIVSKAVVLLDIWAIDLNINEEYAASVAATTSASASASGSASVAASASSSTATLRERRPRSRGPGSGSGSRNSRVAAGNRESVVFHSQPPLAGQRLEEVNDALTAYLGIFIHRMSILETDASAVTQILVNTRKSMLACRELLAAIEAISGRALPRSRELERAKDVLFIRIRALTSTAREVVSSNASFASPERRASCDRLVDIAAECAQCAVECVVRCRNILARVGDFQMPATREYPDFSDGLIAVSSSALRASVVAPESGPESAGTSPSASMTQLSSATSLTSDPDAARNGMMGRIPSLPATPSDERHRGQSPTRSPGRSPGRNPGRSPARSPARGPVDRSPTRSPVRRAAAERQFPLIAEKNEDEQPGPEPKPMATETQTTPAAIPAAITTNIKMVDAPPLDSPLDSPLETPTTASAPPPPSVDLADPFAHIVRDKTTKRIKGASVEALVAHMCVPDPDLFLVSTFFLTFRQFTTPSAFVDALKAHFEPDTPVDALDTTMTARRVSIFGLCKRWLESHWVQSADGPVAPDLLDLSKQCQLVVPNAQLVIEDLIAKATSADLDDGEQIVPRRIALRDAFNTQPAALAPYTLSASKHQLQILARANESNGYDESLLDDIANSSSTTTNNKNIRNSGGSGDSATAAAIADDLKSLATVTTWTSLRNSVVHIAGGGTPSALYGSLRILDFDPADVASQLTLMDAQVFAQMRASELLDQNFAMKRRHLGLAPQVLRLTTSANQLSSFVSDSILGGDMPLKGRKNVLKHWIKIADKCYEMRNFNAVLSICSALQSVNILRLRRVWEMLSPRYHDVFQRLKALLAPEKNFAAYRQELRHKAPPCVPYLGIFLSDLIFIEEGNSKTRSLGEGLPDVVNVVRFERIAKVIGELQRLQVPYHLAACKELQIWLRGEMAKAHVAVTKDHNGLWRRSCIIEPKNN